MTMAELNLQTLIDQGRIDADTNVETFLLNYSNLTQALTPGVNDTIKIDLPTGERWLVVHLPSLAEVEEQERVKMSKFFWEIRVMLAFLCGVFGLMLVALLFMPSHGHVPPGQHLRDMRALSWGIFLLVLSGWTYWCKPPERAPDASA